MMERAHGMALRVCAATVCGFVPGALGAETMTYADLVRRMVAPEPLAVLPEPGERCAQWSSYNRASRYDAATGHYVEWDANGDGAGFIRQTDESLVIAEMQGPGCIWRIWSAQAGEGHVKIYLDGQPAPAVDLPWTDYFKGSVKPFDHPALSYDLSKKTGDKARGLNLYMPVPYQTSCRIVATRGWGRYYHITYSTFPQGTKVPTFRSDLPADATAALKTLNAFAADRLGSYPVDPPPGQTTQTLTASAAPGQILRVAELNGPRSIAALRVNMTFAGRADEMAALRQLVLRITFDGQAAPSVECPLGDFFGTAPGVNEYTSLMSGMTADGFYSFWYMPFDRQAVIELANDGPLPREVAFEIVHAPLERPFSRYGYFHAKWHRDVMPVGRDRWPDWTVLATRGRGRFCGMMLHVWNPRDQKAPGNGAAAMKAAAPGQAWWGEGDEKFFVDGESFPSTYGTGTEDYFGYAWGGRYAGLFQTPFHCQTLTQANRGHQSLLRWQIADNIPFQTSFAAYLEKYFANDWPTRFACVAYWYLSPDGTDPFDPAPPGERLGWYAEPHPQPTSPARPASPANPAASEPGAPRQ